jgi:hypothetical protein
MMDSLARHAPPATTLEGILERVSFINEENAWSVVKLDVPGKQDLVTAVGNLLGVQPGESLRLSGRWLVDRKYGEQFKVDSYVTVKPATLVGIEGNTVTRLYFLRLRRLTREAMKTGTFTRELERARAESVPAFTHFLDLPMLFLIVALGAIKPTTWTLFIVGSVVALSIATVLTLYIPRLYPWAAESK